LFPSRSRSYNPAMGDLRNKINKIERAKADKAAMEALARAFGWREPKATPPQPEPRCHCGKTWKDTPSGSLYGVCGADGKLTVVCDAHLPADA
jgi:hypothetical protein